MKIRGLREALKVLEYASNEIPKKIQVQRRRSGRIILNEAKTNAPKLTGKLRNSGYVEEMPNNTAITFSAFYAPFLEFGTGGNVSIPRGFEELAVQFKGSGKGTFSMRPQPYLIPAFLKESINYRTECEKILKTVQR